MVEDETDSVGEHVDPNRGFIVCTQYYTVHCGGECQGCWAHAEGRNERQAVTFLREETGWRQVPPQGWLCPECAQGNYYHEQCDRWPGQ